VNAKLLFCHPPPSYSADEFNRGAQKLALRRIARKKRGTNTRIDENTDAYPFDGTTSDPSDLQSPPSHSQKSRSLDRLFFDETTGLAARPFTKDAGGRVQSVSRPVLYPHHVSAANDGTPLARQGLQIGTVMANAGRQPPGKKGHKKMKRTKQRSGEGYD
jgi:large subunit GTPase 1